MATYVPGVETYLPDIKPFTPDYKFLSAVLDVRQDKYNSNWKATNELYNKVVYAELSRKDTKDQRDQYTQQLIPSLEKIAGMDLSMAQNVDSAKSVFAPFFEDDLIVSDMMHTANYRKEMDYANRLLDSPNDKQRDRYSADGIKGLQYHMDDFINADATKALSMGLPKFIENANLIETAQEILGAMKPPLKIKMDHLSENGDWQITEQNGNLVVGAALEYLKASMMNDPRIIRHYENQAFVRGRDFAAEGIARGDYSTIKEGQSIWANETINRVKELNGYLLKKDVKALETAKDVNVRWDNYKANNGVVPGSDDEKAMKEELSVYEATKAALEARENIQREVNSPIGSVDGALSKAYSLLMQINMGGDMQTAAKIFSVRDSEYTMKPNEFAVQYKQFQIDTAKIAQQGRNAIAAINRKGEIDEKLSRLEGKIKPVAQPGTLDWSLGLGEIWKMGDERNSNYNTDPKTGLPDANADVNAIEIAAHQKNHALTIEKELDVVTSVLNFLEPNGESNNSGKYTVKIGGVDFTGNIIEIKNKLGERVKLADGTFSQNYTYQNDIEALYDIQSKRLIPENMKKYPGLATTTEYTNLYDRIYLTKPNLATGAIEQSLNDIISTEKLNYKTLMNIHKKASNAVIATAKESGNVKQFIEEGGMPGTIYTTDANGIPKQMSKQEYIGNVVSLIQAGKVKNIDIPWSWDTGTNNSNYMHTVTKGTGQYYSSRDGEGGSTMNERMEKVTELDMGAINAEAGAVYDAIKLQTNNALTGRMTDKGVKTATLQGLKEGKTSNTDMFTAPVYTGMVDPLTPESKGNNQMARMIDQKRLLDQKGGDYALVLGNLKNRTTLTTEKDALAVKVYNLYLQDLNSSINGNKPSNSAALAPRANITYSNTMGLARDGDKTTAGYTLTDMDTWLDNFIKGSETKLAGAAGEYGALGKDDITLLKDGISFVFQQKDDIHPASINKAYRSKTLAAINASGTNFVEYTVPGIDMTPTGIYKIVQTGTDQYYASYSENIYQPNGSYINSGPIGMPVNLSDLNAGFNIDLKSGAMYSLLQSRRALNQQAKDKNNAVNGKK